MPAYEEVELEMPKPKYLFNTCSIQFNTIHAVVGHYRTRMPVLHQKLKNMSSPTLFRLDLSLIFNLNELKNDHGILKGETSTLELHILLFENKLYVPGDPVYLQLRTANYDEV